MKRYFLTIFVMLLWLLPWETWAYTTEDCIECHRLNSKESVLQISVEEFQSSIHSSEITCEDCHTKIKDEAHEEVKGSGAVDCNECHEQENRHGLESKSNNLPQCYSCHPKHRMLEKENEASSVHPGQLKKTCKGCHPIESGEIDYVSWLPSIRIKSHKKQDFSQTYGRDNCLGCHQGQAAHGGEEQLNEQNCHLCHGAMKDQGALAVLIHARADSGKQPFIFGAAVLYQIFIVLFLWGGFRFYILPLFGKGRKRRK